MKRYRGIALILGMVMLWITIGSMGAATEKAPVFSDVPEDYWAKTELDAFVEEGLINGYEDGTFRPEAGVTREEFAKLLVLCFGKETAIYSPPSFADVTPERWSYPYVELCSDVMPGSGRSSQGEKFFYPEKSAVREDMATALVRMMGYTEQDDADRGKALAALGDEEAITQALVSYVCIAYEKGLIAGYPDKTFGPKRGITRAEAVVLLYRAMEQAEQNHEVTEPETPAVPGEPSVPALSYGTGTDPAAHLVVIEAIGQGVQDGTEVLAVDYYIRDQKRSAMTSPKLRNVLMETLALAQRGDLFKLKIEAGLIVDSHPILIFQRDGMMPYEMNALGLPRFFVGGEKRGEDFYFGVAVKAANGGVTLALLNGKTGTAEDCTDDLERILEGEATVYLYDPELRDVRQIQPGSLGDVDVERDLANQGNRVSGGALETEITTPAYGMMDYVFARYYNDAPADIVIYKNYDFGRYIVEK